MTTTTKYATLAEEASANEMRLLCADILEGLALSPSADLATLPGVLDLTRGARALRWTAEWSGATDPADLIAEIYRLTDALEEAEGALQDVCDEVLGVVAGWDHGEDCDMDSKACECELSQRRTQIQQAASRG